MRITMLKLLHGGEETPRCHGAIEINGEEIPFANEGRGGMTTLDWWVSIAPGIQSAAEAAALADVPTQTWARSNGIKWPLHPATALDAFIMARVDGSINWHDGAPR